MHKRAFQQGARIPMTTETYQRLALQLRMAGEALITHPTPDTYNQLSKLFATLGRAGLAGDQLDLGNDALSDICDRFEEEGRIRITDVEAEHIRTALGRGAKRVCEVRQERQACVDRVAVDECSMSKISDQLLFLDRVGDLLLGHRHVTGLPCSAAGCSRPRIDGGAQHADRR